MTRNKKTASSVFIVASLLCCCVQFLSSPVRAQQTLGGITGTVTDASGGILPNTTVNLVNDQTKLSRTQTTNGIPGASTCRKSHRGKSNPRWYKMPA